MCIRGSSARRKAWREGAILSRRDPFELAALARQTPRLIEGRTRSTFGALHVLLPFDPLNAELFSSLGVPKHSLQHGSLYAHVFARDGDHRKPTRPTSAGVEGFASGSSGEDRRALAAVVGLGRLPSNALIRFSNASVKSFETGPKDWLRRTSLRMGGAGSARPAARTELHPAGAEG